MNTRIVFSTFLCGILFCAGNRLSAQTPVALHITHQINGGDFAYNKAGKNDLGNDFNVTRLEYYISGISIKHDGGMVTKVPGHYILVDAGQDVKDDLGSFNITDVESISFHIGVDTPINHADPSLQPAGHPLAPKSPSMHWGWTSGYRFVALEGKYTPAFNQVYEIHALGDQNYFETTVVPMEVMQGGKLIIPIRADYAQALKGIDMSVGVTVHSDDAEAAQLLANFRDHVFSAWFPASVGTATASSIATEIYPNPSQDGKVCVDFHQLQGSAKITVYDIQGRIVAASNKAANESKIFIQLPSRGLFLIKVQLDNGETVIRKAEML